jgi:hypothetical protein
VEIANILNVHVVVSCDASDDCLRLRFNQGEVLPVLLLPGSQFIWL